MFEAQGVLFLVRLGRLRFLMKVVVPERTDFRVKRGETDCQDDTFRRFQFRSGFAWLAQLVQEARHSRES